MRRGDGVERWQTERSNGRSSRKWTFKEQPNKKKSKRNDLWGGVKPKDRVSQDPKQ